jgi:phage terminase large subunit-like protein
MTNDPSQMSPTIATSTNSVAILRAGLRRLSQASQNRLMTELPARERDRFMHDFPVFAHAHQEPPAPVADGRDWTTWLVLGGRGAGKTATGAAWVKALALGEPPMGVKDGPVSRIALVGETEHEAREVMVEGVSGILAAHQRAERPTWTPSRKRLEWHNGAVAQAFSAEDPESLRGSQFGAAWSDELAKWRQAEAAFDMLQFGLRLGARPRQVVTTTPRPIALLKRLGDDPATAVTHAATQANAVHLAPAFIDTVLARYAGTRLGRQEIDGEIVEERADALWSRSLIENARVAAAPALARIVVAVDPPASHHEGSSACGLVAAGVNQEGTIYVLADATVAGLTPVGWAARAVALWRSLSADALVVEVNHGGDMVKSVLAQADADVPVTSVRATRGKFLRAEPVAALYEQGRVKHAGVFARLEDEMCDFGPTGLSSGRSPDRLDALVWAVASLSFGARKVPRIRLL